MLHDVEPMDGSIVVTQVVDAHAEDASFEDAIRTDDGRLVAHATELAEPPRRASYCLAMPQKRSSILAELGWLAYFVIVFVAAVYALVGLLVPHHFNDKIAIALAAIFAGLVMIGTRAWVASRRRPRS